MRYFKCEKINTDENEILKVQYAKLCAKAKKQYRRAQVFRKMGHVVFGVVTLGAFTGWCCLLSKIIAGEEENIILAIGLTILKLIPALFGLIISAILGALVALPLWGKSTVREKDVRQQYLHEACETLREYYGFREPFLVTKCYSCTDRKFDRHDVCLFVVEDELRITANVNYGFFHPDRDLGCYGLTRQEISLSPVQYKESNALQLEADGVTFLLGTRAQGFINTNFLNDQGK